MKIAAKPRKQRFAVFVRVSTRDQLAGHSLKQQERQAIAYINGRGQHVKTYSGQESGTSDDRRLLDMALKGAGTVYDHLVIQDTSRLSRNPGVMFQAMSRLADAGVQLHDFNGPLPFDTPEGEFRLMIDSVIGRFTARQNVEKSLNNRLALLEDGAIAAGRPPWGRVWMKAEKRFLIDPARHSQIKLAHSLIVKRGYSLNRAAAELSKVGPRIAQSSLRKAIIQASKTEIIQRLQGKTFRFACPALLTAAQTEQIRQRLAENTVAIPGTGRKYLLQGLVRCKCGLTMSGQTGTKNGYAYSTYRHPVGKLKDGCTWAVPADLLDASVLEACGWLIWSRRSLKQAIQNAVGRETDERDDLETRARELRTELRDELGRIERAVQAHSDHPVGSIARRKSKESIARAERAVASKRIELKDVEQRMRLLSLPTVDANAVSEQLRHLFPRDALSSPESVPFHDRQAFVRAIVGRSDRKSDAGVYIEMFRLGGGKKNVKWTWELHGRFVRLQNYVDRTDELYEPEVLRLGAIDPQTAREMAKLAERSARGVQLSTKCSSGGSPRCV